MDHSPQVPADDRALRLLDHADIPAPRKERVRAAVLAAQDAARASGADLQAEFGPTHVALIVGCNQFLRVFRSGPEPGAVELLLDAPEKQALAQAGAELRAPEGAVFKLFGWVRVDPSQPPQAALEDATRKAFEKAQRAKKK